MAWALRILPLSKRLRLLTGIAVIVFSMMGCNDDGPSAQSRASGLLALNAEQSSGIGQPTADGTYKPVKARGELRGDLDAIIKRGRLRLLVPANVGGGRYLPRKGSPVSAQQEAAMEFARLQGLKVEIIPLAGLKALMDGLKNGQGDVLVANLTITPQRNKQLNFSLPLAHVREQILVRADDKKVKRAKDLAGRRVMVDPLSSFWASMQKLKRKVPGVEIVERPKGLLDEAELDLLVAGKIDAVVRDDNIAQMYLGYRDDIRIAFNLGGARSIAWGLRKDSPKLKKALDEFLHLNYLAEEHTSISTVDLDGIRKRKVIRVLMPNNAASYFLYKGKLVGFEYELAKAYAKHQKLRLEIVVPPDHETLLTWLKEGRGDFSAGFLEPTEQRKQQGFAFSRPYHFAARHIVTRKDDSMNKIEDLKGRTVVLRRSSAAWNALQTLRDGGLNFELKAAAEDIETEDLIEQVARGDIDVTAADGHLLNLAKVQGVAVKSAVVLGDKLPHAIAFRPSNPKLLASVNSFIKKNYKGLVYNVLYKKYFLSVRSVNRLAKGRVDKSGDGSLSPYDPIVRKYAKVYGFDWRLVTSQMYQESRFDPKARSFAGALGLLQVLPRTAKSMGVKASHLERPERGVQAGVKYMSWLQHRFDSNLPFSPRLWFSLASYNAGLGHVQDARRLAKQMGLDGDRWFGNAERAMLLLAKKKYAKKARHGYVRGREPVNYVRQIRERYEAYVRLTEGRELALLNSNPIVLYEK